jgi:hypothetical protein
LGKKRDTSPGWMWDYVLKELRIERECFQEQLPSVEAIGTAMGKGVSVCIQNALSSLEISRS